MSPQQLRIAVPAPGATQVVLHLADRTVVAEPDGDLWWAQTSATPGEHYWLTVDGGQPLVDPGCRDLAWTAAGPRSVVRAPWPICPQAAPLAHAPVVYELHVRGFGRTFRGCIEHLDHVASTGANVIELMPVHPFDSRVNYWGYMPVVWGAVHREYAERPERAAEELAELVAAAHARGMHVWLDVVFNHTGEGDPTLPTYTLRGLDRRGLYRHTPDGRPTDDSGCGNDVDPTHPFVRRLVLEALERFADLGIDGFRFDLASLLTRDGGGLVELIGEWGRARGVRLIAEPWDLAAYEVGSPRWPADWLQWNDRFRDDVRGFLRGEPGLVPAIRERVQGSPDLFGTGTPTPSLNFVTAHDGLTMHDLTAYTSDRHRSWDTGGDLRMQQMKNYFTLLLLSAGTPMWVMGDEFARTQHGHDNPYDVDGPLTWVDWTAAERGCELTDHVRALVALRRAHPPGDFRFHGVGAEVDDTFESRSLAWCAGDLYVMVNAWWQPLTFGVHEPGEWKLALSTADARPTDDDRWRVPPRSCLVLRR